MGFKLLPVDCTVRRYLLNELRAAAFHKMELSRSNISHRKDEIGFPHFLMAEIAFLGLKASGI